MSTIPKIQNVQDLIRILDYDPGYDGYIEILKSIEFGPEELEPYLTWREDRYTRNLISSTDSYELLVMCWEKGQQTSIHDYNSQEGWAYVIDGELTEERFYEDKTTGEPTRISSVKVDAGNFSYMTDMIGKHRFMNTNDGRTISLHIYAEPVKEWNAYNEETGSFETQKVHFDSVEGKKAENSHDR